MSFEYCLKITKNHYENFPVASLAIPRKYRPFVAAVYAFARAADDFADEKEFEGTRLDRLNEWDEKLKNCAGGKADHPVFAALGETIRKFNLPVSLFSDLLAAFKMDTVVSRYETFDQVLNYCRHSANPVGRIILHLFGFPAPRLLEYSDFICTALQLANFWQDVAVDLEKDRIYIPREDFVRFRYSEEELKKKVENDNFRRLILFQVERTEDLFDRGKSLCGKIPGRLGFELRLTWLGGATILKKILALNGNMLSNRPKLTKRDLPSLLFGALQKRTFG
ncbi:MAG: squalene synthase HpnC [Deltaproteobacteria bacterium]|nr:squalene synthase HpnC [Deltaproteobacteria bacterium]